MAIAREQLFGLIVSPAMREHAIMEETFSELSVVQLRVAFMRYQNFVAEAVDSSRMHRNGNACG
jgi:hypothetical protein